MEASHRRIHDPHGHFNLRQRRHDSVRDSDCIIAILTYLRVSNFESSWLNREELKDEADKPMEALGRIVKMFVDLAISGIVYVIVTWHLVKTLLAA
jgi:hypothetical protein